MKNIVIYAPRKESNIADLLEKEFEDANIRVEEDYTLKEYETLNPSLIITENVTLSLKPRFYLSEKSLKKHRW